MQTPKPGGDSSQGFIEQQLCSRWEKGDMLNSLRLFEAVCSELSTV